MVEWQSQGQGGLKRAPLLDQHVQEKFLGWGKCYRTVPSGMVATCGSCILERKLVWGTKLLLYLSRISLHLSLNGYMWLVVPVWDNPDREAEINNPRPRKQLSNRDKHKPFTGIRKRVADHAWEEEDMVPSKVTWKGKEKSVGDKVLRGWLPGEKVSSFLGKGKFSTYLDRKWTIILQLPMENLWHSRLSTKCTLGGLWIIFRIPSDHNYSSPTWVNSV